MRFPESIRAGACIGSIAASYIGSTEGMLVSQGVALYTRWEEEHPELNDCLQFLSIMNTIMLQFYVNSPDELAPLMGCTAGLSACAYGILAYLHRQTPTE